MNLLLDTCGLLALSNGTLTTAAVRALRTAPEACVSAVSAWEVAIKVSSGKLTLRQSPARWFEAVLDRHRIREIPLDHAQACDAAALPPIHRDPFDRVLIALALSRSLSLITNDRFILQYPNLDTLW